MVFAVIVRREQSGCLLWISGFAVPASRFSEYAVVLDCNIKRILLHDWSSMNLASVLPCLTIAGNTSLSAPDAEGGSKCGHMLSRRQLLSLSLQSSSQRLMSMSDFESVPVCRPIIIAIHLMFQFSS